MASKSLRKNYCVIKLTIKSSIKMKIDRDLKFFNFSSVMIGTQSFFRVYFDQKKFKTDYDCILTDFNYFFNYFLLILIET